MPIYRTGTNVYTPQQTGYGPTGAGTANTAGAIFHAGRFTTGHHSPGVVESIVIPAPERFDASYSQAEAEFVPSDHPLTGTVAGSSTSTGGAFSPLHTLVGQVAPGYGHLNYGDGVYGGQIATKATATEIIDRDEIVNALTGESIVRQSALYGEHNYGDAGYGGGAPNLVYGSSLAVGHPLTSTVAGTSTATTGALIVSAALTANIIVPSTATATQIQVIHALGGNTAGVSTALGSSIAIAQPLVANAAGSSTASVDAILVSNPLVAAIAGASTVTASRLALEQPLTGAIGATSTVDATQIVRTQQMTGNIAGTATAFADLTVGSSASNHPLSSTVAAAALVAAERIVLEQPLAASVAATSTAASNDVVVSHILVVTVAGTSTVAIADLLTDAPHPLEAALAGLSTTTATLLSPTPDPFTFSDDETRIFITRIDPEPTFAGRRRAGIFR